jgi:hypothetical protein
VLERNFFFLCSFSPQKIGTLLFSSTWPGMEGKFLSCMPLFSRKNCWPKWWELVLSHII